MKKAEVCYDIESLRKVIFDYEEGVQNHKIKRVDYPHLDDPAFVKEFLASAMELSRVLLEGGDTEAALNNMSVLADSLRILEISKKAKNFPSRLHTLWFDFMSFMYLSAQFRIEIVHWLKEAEQVQQLTLAFVNSDCEEFDELEDYEKVCKSLRKAYQRFVIDPRFRPLIAAYSPDGVFSDAQDEE